MIDSSLSMKEIYSRIYKKFENSQNSVSLNPLEFYSLNKQGFSKEGSEIIR